MTCRPLLCLKTKCGPWRKPAGADATPTCEKCGKHWPHGPVPHVYPLPRRKSPRS